MIPIALTILSTIIGLMPFLIAGKDERFWFSLAAGTIGGLVFSMIGLIFFLPIFMKLKQIPLPEVLRSRFIDRLRMKNK